MIPVSGNDISPGNIFAIRQVFRFGMICQDVKIGSPQGSRQIDEVKIRWQRPQGRRQVTVNVWPMLYEITFRRQNRRRQTREPHLTLSILIAEQNAVLENFRKRSEYLRVFVPVGARPCENLVPGGNSQ